MAERNRDLDHGTDDARQRSWTPDPTAQAQTGIGREPWVNRTGEGDEGDMGDTRKIDVTPPDTNSGEIRQPG